MIKNKIKYRAGDCFAVPLRTSGYAIGVVGQKARGVMMIGYFFAQKFPELPTDEVISGLREKDAILVARCGGVGLWLGEWQIIGKILNWDKEPWKMPKFVRFTSHKDVVEIVTYQKDLVNDACIEPAPASEALNYHADTVSTYTAIEVDLTQRLDAKYS